MSPWAASSAPRQRSRSISGSPSTPDKFVQLDEVVAVTTELPVRPAGTAASRSTTIGVVDAVESAYEGASFHSDVFRDAEGTLPVAGLDHRARGGDARGDARGGARDGGAGAAEAGPGRAARGRGGPRRWRCTSTRWSSRFPAGLSRDGKPVYGNLEFLDGTRGAHVNISGISGVATKTTYALFLLYGLFHSSSLNNAALDARNHLQREGRGPALAGQAQRPPARGRAPQVRQAWACRWGRSAASGSGRRRSAATWSCRTRGRARTA